MSIPVPILDSHIHLFPSSELHTLAWNSPSHPLWRQHAPADYRAATDSSSDLLSGYVFLETDRRVDQSDPSPAGGWALALAEVSWLARIASGRPRDGEGHEAGAQGVDARMCLGIVPWAPVPAGAEALGRYVDAARGVCEEVGGVGGVWGRVKGFRYLLQDKPDGTMLEEGFVEGVRFLGREGFSFDVGIDLHRRGRSQLEECVELVERAHEGVGDKEKVVFILNHLCKPDLTITNPEADPGFIAWRTAMFTLSKADNTYMKLSGCLSEMTPELARSSPATIFEAISPWLAVVVATFGPSRIMFGSDWPVCTVGLDTEKNDDEDKKAAAAEAGDADTTASTGGAWDKWRLVVERMCDMYGFDEDQTRMIFSGTARKAYGI